MVVVRYDLSSLMLEVEYVIIFKNLDAIFLLFLSMGESSVIFLDIKYNNNLLTRTFDLMM